MIGTELTATCPRCKAHLEIICEVAGEEVAAQATIAEWMRKHKCAPERGVHGTAKDHPPLPSRWERPRFSSLGAMLRWHYAHGVVPGMDPSRDGAHLDAHAREERDDTRARVIGCVATLTERQEQMVRMQTITGSRTAIVHHFAQHPITIGKIMADAFSRLHAEARARGLVPG